MPEGPPADMAAAPGAMASNRHTTGTQHGLGGWAIPAPRLQRSNSTPFNSTHMEVVGGFKLSLAPLPRAQLPRQNEGTAPARRCGAELHNPRGVLSA